MSVYLALHFLLTELSTDLMKAKCRLLIAAGHHPWELSICRQMKPYPSNLPPRCIYFPEYSGRFEEEGILRAEELGGSGRSRPAIDSFSLGRILMILVQRPLRMFVCIHISLRCIQISLRHNTAVYSPSLISLVAVSTSIDLSKFPQCKCFHV